MIIASLLLSLPFSTYVQGEELSSGSDVVTEIVEEIPDNGNMEILENPDNTVSDDLDDGQAEVIIEENVPEQNTEEIETIPLEPDEFSAGEELLHEGEEVPLGKATNPFVIEGTVLKKYRGTDVKVTIPDTVTEIAEEAFYDCKEVQSVVIPDSVEKIGDYAFAYCEELKKVTK